MQRLMLIIVETVQSLSRHDYRWISLQISRRNLSVAQIIQSYFLNTRESGWLKTSMSYLIGSWGCFHYFVSCICGIDLWTRSFVKVESWWRKMGDKPSNEIAVHKPSLPFPEDFIKLNLIKASKYGIKQLILYRFTTCKRSLIDTCLYIRDQGTILNADEVIRQNYSRFGAIYRAITTDDNSQMIE